MLHTIFTYLVESFVHVFLCSEFSESSSELSPVFDVKPRSLSEELQYVLLQNVRAPFQVEDLQTGKTF